MGQNIESKDKQELNLLRELAQTNITKHLGGQQEVLMRKLLCQLWIESSNEKHCITDILKQMVITVLSGSAKDENMKEVHLMRKLLVLFWGERNDFADTEDFKEPWRYLTFCWKKQHESPVASSGATNTEVESVENQLNHTDEDFSSKP